MILNALALSMAISPALADNDTGVFQLEPPETPTITEATPSPKPDSRAGGLKDKAAALVRKAAVFVNTNRFIGNPDLPEAHRDVLPHEAFKNLKDAYLRERRAKRDRKARQASH